MYCLYFQVSVHVSHDYSSQWTTRNRLQLNLGLASFFFFTNNAYHKITVVTQQCPERGRLVNIQHVCREHMEVKFLDQLVCSSGLVNYARETLEGLGEKGTRAVVQSLPRAAKTAKETLMKPEKKKHLL